MERQEARAVLARVTVLELLRCSSRRHATGLWYLWGRLLPPEGSPFLLRGARIKYSMRVLGVRDMSLPTILIVEPDSHIARVLQITLEETLTVETVVAEELSQVRQLVYARNPALVVVDVFTRKLNAFEVIALLKATAVSRQTPVIALGPRGRQVELARAMGCQEIVSLPFRVPDIVSKVLRHLDAQPKLRSPDIGHLAASVARPEC